jgi:hypothetical protein
MNPEHLMPSKAKKEDSAEAQDDDDGMRYALINRPSPPF